MDWLNQKLSSYIDKKEKIVFDVRINEKMCELASVGASFLFSVVVSGLTAFLLFTVSDNYLWPVSVGVFSFIILFVLFSRLFLLSNQSVRYVLTEHGIYKICGLIFKSVKFVAYNKITDLTMCSGPFERLFGCGSVGIGTASGGNINKETGFQLNELDIKSVNEYKKIKDFLTKKVK